MTQNIQSCRTDTYDKRREELQSMSDKVIEQSGNIIGSVSVASNLHTSHEVFGKDFIWYILNGWAIQWQDPVCNGNNQSSSGDAEALWWLDNSKPSYNCSWRNENRSVFQCQHVWVHRKWTAQNNQMIKCVFYWCKTPRYISKSFRREICDSMLAEPF